MRVVAAHRDDGRVMSERSFIRYFLGFVLTSISLLGFQRVEQESFPLPPGGMVKIDAYRGEINVVAGAADRVRVIVNVSVPAETAEAGRQVLEGFALTGAVNDGVVTISTRNPRDGSVRFVWSKDPRPEITLTVEVPERVDLDLQTGEGGINVESLTGRMRARAEHGTIFFRQIDGDVEARTGTGDILVSRCTGSVTLRAVQGSVRIGAVGGRASLETVSGDIELQSAHGIVTAVTKAGDIEAGFAEVTGGAQLETALGNIHARVNPAAAFSLRAVSGWGPVESRLSLEGEGNARGSRLSGLHNGGGPLLELKAGGGRVSIAPGEDWVSP